MPLGRNLAKTAPYRGASHTAGLRSVPLPHFGDGQDSPQCAFW
jgi:hypothetical protein